MGKAEDDLVVTHDSPNAQGSHFVRVQIKGVGQFSSRAGDFWLFFEMLLNHFHIGKWCNAPQKLGSHQQKIDA